ncbi:MAG: prepilin-type N-terminal cleavage/methylation domain-containing protein [bacterium]
MMNRRNLSFTLIELLIVVAIIGILAAIAVPNFLNARLRAKVTRAYSDMGSLGKALDMYFLDHNDFPTSNYRESYPTRPFRRLTTPIAYMSGIPHDAFRDAFTVQNHSLLGSSGPDYTYYMCNDTDAYDGPNTRGKPNGPAGELKSFDWFMMSPGPHPDIVWTFYNLSNGLESGGCIYCSNSKEELSTGGSYDAR